MAELDLFSAPSGPKVCAKCVYICEGLSDRGTYYCDLSKKTVRPDDTCLLPGDPHASRFQEVRV
ncbi:MAG: hypothetical protein WC455_28420 [Dehalococcoidia bacterium]|jgi:hypothetical protein